MSHPTDDFLDMAFRGYARKTLPPETWELIEDYAAWAHDRYGVPLEGITSHFLQVALSAHEHAEKRHKAYLAGLLERMEGSTHA